MGTLNKLKAKTVTKTEETKKAQEKVIHDKLKPADGKQREIRRVSDMMRNSLFADANPIYIPKHKKRKRK